MPFDDAELVEIVEIVDIDAGSDRAGLADPPMGVPVAANRATGGAARPPAARSGADVLAGNGRGSTGLDRWTWWRRTSPVGRRLIILSAGLTGVALVAGLAALEQPQRVERLTRTVVVAPAPSGVDALGCPIGRRCAVREPTLIVAAVRRRVPAARVLDASEVYDVDSGIVYRSEVVARSDRTPGVLRLVAQCLPSGGRMSPVPASVRHALDPTTLEGSVVTEKIVAPAPGCTSYVMVQEPDPGGSSAARLSDQVGPLADDLQVILR